MLAAHSLHPQAWQSKMSPEIAKWPPGDKTTSLRTTGLEVMQLIFHSGEGAWVDSARPQLQSSEHSDGTMGKKGVLRPEQKRRSSRKQESRYSWKAVAGEDTSSEGVGLSSEKNYSKVSKSTLLELAREDQVFIQIWLNNDFQGLWDLFPRVSFMSLGHISASWRQTLGFSPRMWQDRGKKRQFHCLLSVLPCSLPSPPKLHMKFHSKEKFTKLKTVKSSAEWKRKRTIWMRGRSHKMCEEETGCVS